MHHIAVVVGSLRKGSNSGKLARALEVLGGDRFEFETLDLMLPLYNDDLWAHPPAEVLKLKERVAAADAVLFITPEYNRSVPPVVKNAIDWGSRPHGQSAWKGKLAGVVGSSTGAIGSAVAQSHLRSVLVTLDVTLLGLPEVYFQFKPEAIDADGKVADDGARKLLQTYIDRFDAWVTAHRK
jgi:chromate reductase